MIKKAQETKKDTAEQHVSCRESIHRNQSTRQRVKREETKRQGEDKNQIKKDKNTVKIENQKLDK